MSYGAGNGEPPSQNNPSFCKIIVPAVLDDGMLLLPSKFVGKYGDNLPDVVTLKVPKSKEWSVELLKKAEGEVYFHKGLHEFVEYYSISAGHVLFFEYDRSSRFLVVICDMTGSEINYDKYEGDDKGAGHPVPKEGRKVPRHEHETFRNRGALGAAKALKLENPSFIVTMQPSYQQYLPIPSNFSKTYFREKIESATLRVSDRRKWEVGSFTDAKDYYKLVKGWRAFLKGTKLKSGNVCVFELIKIKNKSKRVVLNAHIF